MKKSMMKKLVVLLVVMVVAGGFVFGAEDTAASAASNASAQSSLDLNGTVLDYVSIVLADASVDFEIDPVDGLSGEVVTTATLSANTSYTIDGLGDRTLTSGDNTTIGYTLSMEYTGEVANGEEVDVVVDVPSSSDGNSDVPYEAGTYSETVTLTIESN